MDVGGFDEMKKLLTILFALAIVCRVTARVFAETYDSAKSQSTAQQLKAENLEKKHHKKKHKHPPTLASATGSTELKADSPFTHS